VEPLIHPEDLPEHLAERIRATGDAGPQPIGSFVLYWMRTAVRADENPALDVALLAGARLGLPVFVYHALSDRYPFASDRHHRFILEGARDVQQRLADRGIGYAFHLVRPGHRGPHLRTLSEQAALVVTEEMPVRPLRQWTRFLVGAVSTTVWCVDTACVVPMRLVGKAYDRAFAYRKATDALRQERVELDWPTVEPAHDAFMPAVPFEAVDLQSADLPDLIASCEIDHTVGPVPHTPGGETAGHERWSRFRDQGLDRYASRRNDPLRDGVSRMSAYLHYGQVSPFRLAREAAARGGKGAEKFLDELLVWRELAYTYCFYHEDHESIDTLPGWARETLAAHETDPRPALFSHETLSRAKTGDLLWDAAQQSLLIHGELHNNVRMTWGKALLSWTPDARRALELLIDLNHRYALDGRDPASYGGLLWCLGQFDRPFRPENRILGSVRSRPTSAHAGRLDVERYRRRTATPALSPAPRVAVVGAGVSGLICTRTLVDHGLEAVVFDKGRRPGGRLATRVADGAAYDHGAQYFTVGDPGFERRVEAWIHDGVVAEWTGRLVEIEQGRCKAKTGGTRRFVGVPGMNAIAAHLAIDCDVRSGVRVERAFRKQERWHLEHAAGEEGPFDAVVLALPAPQAVPLLDGAPALRERAAGVHMKPCWAVLVTFPSGIDAGFDGAFINDGPLSWVARNGSKPGRETESWVLHATASWSERMLEADPDEVAAQLQDAFASATGLRLPEPTDLQAHRWRYAIPEKALPEACLWDTETALAVCGDWCAGPRAEGAFLSGAAAAGRILGRPVDVAVEPQGALF
jgi:photolyase PhrII